MRSLLSSRVFIVAECLPLLRCFTHSFHGSGSSMTQPSGHFSTQTTTVATQQALKKGFVKGEALRLLRTNSSKDMFDNNIKNFRTRLVSRGYPNSLVDKIFSEVNFADRKNALTQNRKRKRKFYPS